MILRSNCKQRTRSEHVALNNRLSDTEARLRRFEDELNRSRLVLEFGQVAFEFETKAVEATGGKIRE